MEWNVETLNHTVDEELNALPADMRARFTRVVRLIESFGIDRVGQPHVKHLQGRLWEMRLQGRDGIARALYVTVTGQRVKPRQDIVCISADLSRSCLIA
jgi:phage-related protein